MTQEEITHKILGYAMKVHSVLETGFREVIYQRALAIELENQGLDFHREPETTIYYDGIIIGTSRVDLILQSFNPINPSFFYSCRIPNFHSYAHSEIFNYLHLLMYRCFLQCSASHPGHLRHRHSPRLRRRRCAGHAARISK